LDEQLVALDKKKKHDLDLVVDRLVLDTKERARLTDSVELGLREGRGVLIAEIDGKDRAFSEQIACPHCELSFPALAPQCFSFNSPLGFCSECNGLGSRPEMDPELVVPNPELSIRDGAIAPWSAAAARGEGWTAATIDWVARRFGVDLKKPWNKLSPAQQ